MKAWDMREVDGDAMFRIKRKGWPATSSEEKVKSDDRPKEI